MRTIYIWKSDIDTIEFGWEWITNSAIGEDGTDSAPTVFATKMYNGDWSESEGNPGNPGTGTLAQGSDHRFRISHDPNGNDSKRYEMYRDQMYFGFYNQSRMQTGGAVVGGTEAWGLCEDLQTHMWTLQKKSTPGGSWANWSAVYKWADDNTKWWWHDEVDSPPEWWMKHCSTAWCTS